MANKEVDFYFDVGSPAAYLAWTQVPQLARDTGAKVNYKPMLLGGVFQATGNRSPMEVPAKSAWMNEDLSRFARRYGVAYRHNPHFPINTLMLMRGALGLHMRQPDKLVPYADAMFRAIWVEGRNMNDPAEVGKALHEAGFDPQALLALAQDPEVKDNLKAVTQAAVARGVFGAPTFFVGQQMFWGQDRLDFVKEALQ
ncbi:2-hydroxychromene-2-carboxylate isomerase [Ramlibacter humi]|uniref:2-hydroxychromene-2-carboxylate isomerase n=1 Tax=Ramlibacter humi TaxID=2530451 RepID=A0A4Z0BX95_9BURK|nr:2-hydroxychromene-2-carboxylate isomerase [Ramlibacter humi]TFZ03873.1 2-hydroxychromene-2-carboxylate isomerase [Ramlibacter humi]